MVGANENTFGIRKEYLFYLLVLRFCTNLVVDNASSQFRPCIIMGRPSFMYLWFYGKLITSPILMSRTLQIVPRCWELNHKDRLWMHLSWPLIYLWEARAFLKALSREFLRVAWRQFVFLFFVGH